MSAWGVPVAGAGGSGAWADDVDEQEQHGNLPAAPAPGAPLALKEEAFPSLAAAAKEVPSKKKSKAKPLPLGAFLSASAKASASGSRSALDDKAILLNLPKGSSGLPKEDREAGGGGLGGAFKDYGGDRGGERERERLIEPWAYLSPLRPLQGMENPRVLPDHAEGGGGLARRPRGGRRSARARRFRVWKRLAPPMPPPLLLPLRRTLLSVASNCTTGHASMRVNIITASRPS